MAAEDTIRVGDFGNSLTVNLKRKSDGKAYDLTGASSIKYVFLKPDKTSLEKTGELVNSPGTDGKVRYTFVDGDLDKKGAWKYQVWVYWTTTKLLHSDTGTFTVEANLK